MQMQHGRSPRTIYIPLSPALCYSIEWHQAGTDRLPAGFRRLSGPNRIRF